MPTCLVGLGSNVGDRKEALGEALGRLGSRPGMALVAQSRWRQTAPIGGRPGQRVFLNGAVLLETSLSPQAVLEILLAIETELGRQRTERWGPRTIDLDLLLYGERVLETPQLTLPHPRMAYRRFVLEPAADVAAAMLHPTTGWTIARLLSHLNTALPYVAVTGPVGAGRRELARRIAEKTAGRLIAEPFGPGPPGPSCPGSSGNAWAAEIEFLHQRARLLVSDLPQWRGRDRLAVSDFWLDQSLAYARVWLTPAQYEVFHQRWQQLRRKVVRPKLTVVVDAPTSQLLERIRRRGRPAEAGLDAESVERIRRAVLDTLRQPGLGPVLCVAEEGHDRLCAEVLTAVEAMK